MGVYSEPALPRVVDVARNLKEAHPQRRRVRDGARHGSRRDRLRIRAQRSVPPAGRDVGWPRSSPQTSAGSWPASAFARRASRSAARASTPRHSRSPTTASTRPFHVDDVQRSEHRRRATRTAPGPQARGNAACRRAWPGARRSRAPWQHRPNPIQKRLFGGCQLTRPIVDLLKDADFPITELDVYYETGTPKVLGANALGVARPS